MKYLFSFICAIVAGCTYAQQATMWYGVERVVYPDYIAASLGRPMYFQTVNYYLDGDTVINETTYKAFRRGDGKFCAGIRESEDRQQVYIFPTGELMQDPWWERGEHLLYNFDVQIGDTVFAFDGSYSGIDNMGEDLSIQYRWIVQDVQTIDGRKHVLVKGGQLYNHLVEWIEGIGTKYILFENDYDDWEDCWHSTYALCAADDEGNILYSFDTDEYGIHNNNCLWEPLAIDNMPYCTSPIATKLLRDGQLIIQNGDKTFNALGAEVK